VLLLPLTLIDCKGLCSNPASQRLFAPMTICLENWRSLSGRPRSSDCYLWSYGRANIRPENRSSCDPHANRR
jgi:hypothetical protein